MAGTTVNKRDDAMSDGATRQLRLEYNKALDDIELLRAQLALTMTKVNAIITAAATNIAAVAAVGALTLTTVDTAADLLAAKVANQDGTTT
jgi:hypothetical protein